MKILFLCVANSVRSQMAEGLAKHIFGSAAVIISAGAMASTVHPLAIKVMTEIGIDISAQTSKAVKTLDLASMDVIISLCAEPVCPSVPAKVKRQQWSLSTPGDFSSAAEELALFRTIREQLTLQITALKISVSQR